MTHGPEQLQSFLSHLNSLRPAIQFTMEIELDSVIPSLDVLVIRNKPMLATKVHRKAAHTGQYLIFNSNHPSYVKRGYHQRLHKRVSTLCQQYQDLGNGINSLRHDLQQNGYPQGFTDSVVNSKGSSHLSKEGKAVGSVYMPYVKVVSEKFNCIGNRYNIRMIFRTKNMPSEVH
jgi:hypothetical protein